MDCKSLIGKESLEKISEIMNYDFRNSLALPFFENTVDKYQGRFWSSPLFINGLVPYRSAGMCKDFPYGMHLINDMFQYPKNGWRLYAVEVNSFKDLVVHEHTDDANTDGNRIRLLAFQFEQSDDVGRIRGELKINGKTIYLEDGSIVGIDCSLPHSAKLNGRGVFVIFDFVPADWNVKDLIHASLLPQHYYVGKAMSMEEFPKELIYNGKM